MIVYSLNRGETLADLAGKNIGGKVLPIPFLYDIPNNSDFIKQLQSLDKPPVIVVPLPLRAAKSLLTYFGVSFDGIYENWDDVPESIKKQIQEPAQTSSALPELPQRWYPVIDESRCGGCLECVNYCLFGVYEIGKDDKPAVTNPDACRDGCPACARVCPGQAIMFPMCEDKKIAGYGGEKSEENLVDLVDQL